MPFDAKCLQILSPCAKIKYIIIQRSLKVMNIKEYAEIVKKQQALMTDEMIEAEKEQGLLHDDCLEKGEYFHLLEEKHRQLLMEGADILFEKHPEIRNMLSNEETEVGRIKAAVNRTKYEREKSEYFINKMNTIPQLAEANDMNVEIGKACLEYFMAFLKLNNKISSDRKRFFTKEYLAKMDELADDGVMMYFLEMPYFPILDENCDANQVLDSFIFGDYASTIVLFSPFFEMTDIGDSMQRKLMDIDSAIYNMKNGYQRTAARIWFSLLESEHKKCANAFEGFWTKKKEFKNGLERSKKIQELFDQSVNVEWEVRAWEKINAYYKRLVGKDSDGAVNRNALIHGDYDSEQMDITDREVVKIMLMWFNMRLIADRYCYLEEFYMNKTTLIPYLVTLPEDLAIDMINLM